MTPTDSPWEYTMIDAYDLYAWTPAPTSTILGEMNDLSAQGWECFDHLPYSHANGRGPFLLFRRRKAMSNVPDVYDEVYPTLNDKFKAEAEQATRKFPSPQESYNG